MQRLSKTVLESLELCGFHKIKVGSKTYDVLVKSIPLPADSFQTYGFQIETSAEELEEIKKQSPIVFYKTRCDSYEITNETMNNILFTV
jgi:hypothetical protein